ncbi:hypothetical protein K490DRAFT_71845 [Neofusicoccum parvum]|nr:hypothetical protein K490DRAFT_71845 [Neofusicoccum parvum]
MSASPTATEPAKVSQHTFLGVAWGLFATATVFTIFRYFIRVKTFRRLYLDDAWVFAAWLMALASTITWQCLAPNLYLSNAVTSGKLFPPPPDFVSKSETFLRGSVAIIFLFYTSLWCVKLSFLFFFRRLYMNMGRLMRIWWAFVIFAIATWAVCIGTIEYDCLVPPLAEIQARCKTTYSIYFQRTTLVVNCVLDIVTDLMITAIPINMLWKVRISLRRKLALGSVFLVTLITITISIIRVTVVDSTFKQADMSWLYVWTNIEMGAEHDLEIGEITESKATSDRSSG